MAHHRSAVDTEQAHTHLNHLRRGGGFDHREISIINNGGMDLMSTELSEAFCFPAKRRGKSNIRMVGPNIRVLAGPPSACGRAIR